MINFNNLDVKELANAGIVFEHEEDADRFIDYVMSDLEIRIGEELAELVPESKLDEFDLIEDQDEASAWLKKNIPSYREIVARKKRDVEEELLQYKSQIPGIKHNPQAAKKNKREHVRDNMPEPEWLDRIFEENSGKNVSELIGIIDNHFKRAGEAFREGLISEEDFYWSTKPYTIFNKLLEKKQGTKLLLKSHDDGDEICRSFCKWKQTGELQLKPWMERDLISSLDSCTAAEWLFRVIDLLKLPPSYFVGLIGLEEEEYPSIVYEVNRKRVVSLIHGTSHDASEISKAYGLSRYYTRPMRFSIGGKTLRFKLEESQGTKYYGEGIIDGYMKNFGKITIDITNGHKDGVWVGFDQQEITSQEALWGTYLLPNLNDKWKKWDQARLASAYRQQMEYRTLRLPYMLGTDGN